MNYLYEILPENLLYALGWTVVHSIWQGVLIAVLLAFALLAMEKKTAKARYVVANFGLFALLVTSIVTFFFLYQKTPSLSLEEAFLMESVANGEVSLWQKFTNYFNQNLPLIVTVWLMGVVFFILKMLGGLLYIQHLKNNFNEPLNDFWQQKLKEIAQRIPLQKSVVLLESALVKVPMVVGYLKPVILMPIGAVNALTSEQVEAILAHELAHIYRNDYLLNILQTFIETLFYFHPAVWWISGNIRLERENCCDDLAVKLCGNPLNYAKALVSLQEMHAEAPALAMAFSNHKNQLLNRVRRILNQPQNKSNIMEKLMATTLFVVLMIMISFGANAPIENILTSRHFSKTIEIEVEELEDLNVIETKDGQTIIATFVEKDTIPQKKKSVNRSTFSKTCDGVESKISIVDGEIEKLVIDGEKIAKEDFDKYENEISELRGNMNGAIAPPSPPTPPSAPPAPPAPPVPNRLDAPGFSYFFDDTKKVITKKDEAGNTIITITKIDENGNERIISEEIQGNEPDIFFFDKKNDRIFELDNNAPEIVLPEYFALENSNEWEELANTYNWENIAKEDFSMPFLKKEDGDVFPYFENPIPQNLEYKRWRERFKQEKLERQKDGNLSEEWLRQKRTEELEWMEKNSQKMFERLKKEKADVKEFYEKGIPHMEHFMVPQPSFPLFENQQEWLSSPEILQLEKLQDVYQLKELDLLNDLQNELILDGLIQKGELYQLELNDKEFKINGKKQSQKQLKKYLQLLEKQKRKRLKFQSKLS